MRTIVIEAYEDGKFKEGLATEVECKTVLAIRLGMQPGKKSEFLNKFLFDSNHTAFSMYNGPAGDEPRHFEGHTEGVWYIPGDKNTLLHKVTLFLNLRGDGQKHIKFVDDVSESLSALVILTDDFKSFPLRV